MKFAQKKSSSPTPFSLNILKRSHKCNEKNQRRNYRTLIKILAIKTENYSISSAQSLYEG